MTEEIKKEEIKKEEIKVDNKVTKRELSPFIEADDIIVCKLGYYLKDDGSGFIVEGVHDDYKTELSKSSFEVTFRIPTQKDVEIITTKIKGQNINSELGMFAAFSELEYIRALVLIKDWTFTKPCTEDNIKQLHPSFIKSIVTALRNKIGMDGIV